MSRQSSNHQPAPLRPLLALTAKYRQLLLYGLIGGGSATLDLLAFLALYNLLGVNALLATTISTSLGITASFLGNTFFNFKVTDRLHHRFILFYAVGLLGLGLSVAIIYVLHDLAGLNANIAKVISIPLVVAAQYLLNSRISLSKDLDKYLDRLFKKRPQV